MPMAVSTSLQVIVTYTTVLRLAKQIPSRATYPAEGESMYNVVWFRYPHGIEGEAMDAKWREFDDKGKAIDFLAKRVKLISSINWAGGQVEDNNGVWIYEVDDGGDVMQKEII